MYICVWFYFKGQVCADLPGLAAPPAFTSRGSKSSSFMMFLFFSHCGREEEHLRPVYRHQGLLPGCHWGTWASVLSEGLLLFPSQPMWPCKAADTLTWCVCSAEPGRGGLGHGVSSVRGGTTETRRGGRRRRSGERLLSSLVFFRLRWPDLHVEAHLWRQLGLWSSCFQGKSPRCHCDHTLLF